MLSVNAMSGFGARPAAAPVEASFLANGYATAPGTANYTFSGVSFGVADTGRRIVVHIYSTGDGDARIASMTIGGVSGAEIVSATHNVNTYSYLFHAIAPTGTTGDIVVNTTSGNFNNVAFGSWRVLNSDSTVSDTLTNSSEPSTGTIDCPANGVVIAGGGNDSDSVSSNTWTGVSESFEQVFATNRHSTGGFTEYAAAQTDLTVTMDWTTDGANAMVVASFGPG